MGLDVISLHQVVEHWRTISGTSQSGRMRPGRRRRWVTCSTRHGASKEETLAIAAAHVTEKAVLLGGFDSFGDYVHVEGAGELDDGADDLEGLIPEDRKSIG